jgi:hypothetical protein
MFSFSFTLQLGETKSPTLNQEKRKSANEDAYGRKAVQMRREMALHLLNVAYQEKLPLNLELSVSQFAEAFAATVLADANDLLFEYVAKRGRSIAVYNGGVYVVSAHLNLSTI